MLMPNENSSRNSCREACSLGRHGLTRQKREDRQDLRRHQLADQCPCTEAIDGHHDPDHAASGGSHDRSHSQAPEGELPAQQRDLDAVHGGEDEGQRQDLQNRREVRLFEQARDRAGQDQAKRGQEDSGGQRHPEGRVDVAARDLLALNQRVTQSLVHDELREGDEHGRQGHDPEVLGRQEAGEDQEHDQVQELPAPDVEHGPGQPAGDALLQAATL